MQTRSTLCGNEHPTGAGIVLGAPLLDFWRWAFSDLQFNDVRGVFGEWLVAQLLDIPLPPRDSWAACDLVSPGGVRLEVKTAAYIQAWSEAPSRKIVFSGLCGRTWDAVTGFADQRTYNADYYIFCVQIEQDAARWNALDLDQWQFYLLPKATIEQRGHRSISLNALRKLTHELRSEELRTELERLTGLKTEDKQPDVVIQFAALLRQRQVIDAQIATILQRPAQIGHAGEFLAAKIFNVTLNPSASEKGYDGHFPDGKSVNVKWYAKDEGILDTNIYDKLDYYLVFAGPRSSVTSSRGQNRPWLIERVYLFDAQKLHRDLLARGVKLGIATSVAREYWRAAEVYPTKHKGFLLSKQQKEILRLFA